MGDGPDDEVWAWSNQYLRRISAVATLAVAAQVLLGVAPSAAGCDLRSNRPVC
jgi:hypothetical protein